MSVDLDRAVITAAAPHLHEWATPGSGDFTDTGTGAPLKLPKEWGLGMDWIAFNVSSDTDQTVGLTLIAVDELIKQVVGIQVSYNTAPTIDILQAGATGNYMQNPAIFPLSLFPNLSRVQLYLAATVVGAGSAFLVNWNAGCGYFPVIANSTSALTI